jgi:cytochrome c biogenesis protein
MRETVQDEFRYLRIPADENLSIDGFMQLRQRLMDDAHYVDLAKKISAQTPTQDKVLQQQFEQSIVQLLRTFAKGGYTELSRVIEKSIPEPERQKAAETYIKMLNTAAFEAYNQQLAAMKQPKAEMTEATANFLQDALNAMNDLYFYGSPFYFQLVDFEHKEASGLQLTKSPGQKWVYLGSVLLVLGIFSMFYIRERRIWVLFKQNNEVVFSMSTNRKNLDFDEAFSRTQSQLNQVLSSLQ